MITKRSTTQSLEDRGPRYSRHQGVLWMLVCKDCRGITICAWHLDDDDDDDDETTAMISVLIFDNSWVALLAYIGITFPMNSQYILLW